MPDVKWDGLATIVSRTAKDVCGTRQKIGLSPWIDEHLEELEEHKKRISRLTRTIEGCEPAAINHWKEARKSARRQMKKDKKVWEETWWLRVVEEAKTAEGTGNTRKMYQTLRRIGVKDTQNIEEEIFTLKNTVRTL